jgi:hypothetical protein
MAETVKEGGELAGVISERPVASQKTLEKLGTVGLFTTVIQGPVYGQRSPEDVARDLTVYYGRLRETERYEVAAHVLTEGGMGVRTGGTFRSSEQPTAYLYSVSAPITMEPVIGTLD